MIQRRAADAGIKTRIGNHTFRATGITRTLEFKRDEKQRIYLALTRRAFCRIGFQALPDGALELQTESPGTARAIPNEAERRILFMRFVMKFITVEVKISRPRKRR